MTDKAFKTSGSFPQGPNRWYTKKGSSALNSDKKHPRYLNGILCFGFIIVVFIVPLYLNAESPAQILIEGVKDGELENVRAALALPAGLVEDGIVNEKWLERFIEQIPQKAGKSLEPFGFYDPKVTVSSALKDKDAREIRVLIDPGQPVRVAGVHVSIEGPGKNEAALVDLAASFPMSKGAILRQYIYESAKKDIRAKASELGYLDADFSTHVISIIPEELKGEIDLILDTGPLYYFGDIHFSGAPQYSESFLGRYMEFKTGDVFSYDKISLTQRNLINADRFEEVMIHTDKNTVEDHRVPVEISLRPSKPKRLKFGIGYETDIGPKGTIKYEDVNFLGTSHKFESRLDISDPLQAVGVRYTVPDKKDTKSLSLLSFNMKREDETELFTESMTAEFERARTLGKAITGSLFVQAMKERSEAGNEKTNTFLLLPGCRLSGFSYDNMIRPTGGYRFMTEIKGGHQVLGSDTGLIQMTAEGGLVVPLPARFTLLTRAKIGGTVQNEPRADLPIALRFFAGGDQSVRGYGYKSLGPKDINGDVIGGKNLFVGSIELERAIGKDWGVAMFYDAGNAFNDFSNMQLAQGAGIGVRYYTPIGPIKLDVARQIGVKDPSFRLHISVGFGL